MTERHTDSVIAHVALVGASVIMAHKYPDMASFVIVWLLIGAAIFWPWRRTP